MEPLLVAENRAVWMSVVLTSRPAVNQRSYLIGLSHILMRPRIRRHHNRKRIKCNKLTPVGEAFVSYCFVEITEREYRFYHRTKLGSGSTFGQPNGYADWFVQIHTLLLDLGH